MILEIQYILRCERDCHHDQTSSLKIMGVLATLTTFWLAIVSGVVSRNHDAQSFLQLSSNPTSGLVPYCKNEEWISCEQVTVDLTALRGNQSVILPNGETVRLIESSPGADPGSTTAFYQSEDLLDYMTITFFASGSNEVNAVIHEDDRAFSLTPCDQTGADCHVLAEENLDMFNVEDTATNATMRDLELMTKTALEELSDVEDRQEQGRFQQDADGTYVATIKIYYTRQFAQVEPNVNAYISNMISQANAGFRGSQTQVRLQLLCTEQLNNINENQDSAQILSQFRGIKGEPSNLRGTADFAHLLVSQTGNGFCGRGYVGSTRLPFGVSRRGCAILNLTFGHEIGHNLGCSHDRANSNSPDPYAFGYLIPNTGRRTIMAYPNSNHQTRINYYSNPDVRFENTPMGNAGNNCARRIRENARAFASIGSDSNSCGSTSQTIISTCSPLFSRSIPTGSSVVVQYPRFGRYRNFDRCEWLFTTSRGRRLRVQIVERNIERESQCRYDILRILGTTAGNLGFCGSGPSNVYTSAGDSIRLRFTSDRSIVETGFRVIIQAV